MEHVITIGVDEVGRGCWAGPLVVGAVILDDLIIGLKDSKLLTKLQRERLAAVILDKALFVSLGWVGPLEIDQFGLSAAMKLGIHRALIKISIAYDEIIIDGNINYLVGNKKAKALVKADNQVPAVSAASIVAKVARDRYMTNSNREYPKYGFDKHVGYGTALHLEKLLLYGVCDIHRRSFKPIKELIS